jgi:hypothetical protein
MHPKRVLHRSVLKPIGTTLQINSRLSHTGNVSQVSRARNGGRYRKHGNRYGWRRLVDVIDDKKKKISSKQTPQIAYSYSHKAKVKVVHRKRQIGRKR